MAISLNGFPCCYDARYQVQDFLDDYLPLEWVGYGKHLGKQLATAGQFPRPNWPPLRPLKINQICMPTGATRWLYGYLLAPQDTYQGLFQDANAGSQAVTLDIDLGTQFTTDVYILQPRQVTAADGDPLWILPVVDERYNWQFAKRVIDQTGEGARLTWEQILTDLVLALPNFNPGSGTPIAADYLEPHPDILRIDNAAVALDAAVMSVGKRVVRKWDGTTFFQDASQANDQVQENLDTYQNDWQIAGGAIDKRPIASELQLQARRAAANLPHPHFWDYHQITSTEGLSQCAATTEQQTLNIRTSAWAVFDQDGDTPINAQKLQALADQIASDYSAWNCGRGAYDFTFQGAHPWVPSGRDDSIILTLAAEVEIKPTENLEGIERQFKRRINTRAISLPQNFSITTQLSASDEAAHDVAEHCAPEHMLARINSDAVLLPGQKARAKLLTFLEEASGGQDRKQFVEGPEIEVEDRWPQTTSGMKASPGGVICALSNEVIAVGPRCRFPYAIEADHKEPPFVSVSGSQGLLRESTITSTIPAGQTGSATLDNPQGGPQPAIQVKNTTLDDLEQGDKALVWYQIGLGIWHTVSAGTPGAPPPEAREMFMVEMTENLLPGERGKTCIVLEWDGPSCDWVAGNTNGLAYDPCNSNCLAVTDRAWARKETHTCESQVQDYYVLVGENGLHRPVKIVSQEIDCLGQGQVDFVESDAGCTLPTVIDNGGTPWRIDACNNFTSDRQFFANEQTWVHYDRTSSSWMLEDSGQAVQAIGFLSEATCDSQTAGFAQVENIYFMDRQTCTVGSPDIVGPVTIWNPYNLQGFGPDAQAQTPGAQVELARSGIFSPYDSQAWRIIQIEHQTAKISTGKTKVDEEGNCKIVPQVFEAAIMACIDPTDDEQLEDGDPIMGSRTTTITGVTIEDNGQNCQIVQQRNSICTFGSTTILPPAVIDLKRIPVVEDIAGGDTIISRDIDVICAGDPTQKPIDPDPNPIEPRDESCCKEIPDNFTAELFFCGENDVTCATFTLNFSFVSTGIWESDQLPACLDPGGGTLLFICDPENKEDCESVYLLQYANEDTSGPLCCGCADQSAGDFKAFFNNIIGLPPGNTCCTGEAQTPTVALAIPAGYDCTQDGGGSTETCCEHIPLSPAGELAAYTEWDRAGGKCPKKCANTTFTWTKVDDIDKCRFDGRQLDVWEAQPGGCFGTTRFQVRCGEQTVVIADCDTLDMRYGDGVNWSPWTGPVCCECRQSAVDPNWWAEWDIQANPGVGFNPNCCDDPDETGYYVRFGGPCPCDPPDPPAPSTCCCQGYESVITGNLRTMVYFNRVLVADVELVCEASPLEGCLECRAESIPIIDPQGNLCLGDEIDEIVVYCDGTGNPIGQALWARVGNLGLCAVYQTGDVGGVNPAPDLNPDSAACCIPDSGQPTQTWIGAAEWVDRWEIGPSEDDPEACPGTGNPGCEGRRISLSVVDTRCGLVMGELAAGTAEPAPIPPPPPPIPEDLPEDVLEWLNGEGQE